MLVPQTGRIFIAKCISYLSFRKSPLKPSCVVLIPGKLLGACEKLKVWREDLQHLQATRLARPPDPE